MKPLNTYLWEKLINIDCLIKKRTGEYFIILFEKVSNYEILELIFNTIEIWVKRNAPYKFENKAC